MTPRSRIPGNRHCKYGGCRVWGGARYMDEHEERDHVRCTCDWVGAQTSWLQHVAQRVRHTSPAERSYHRIAEHLPELKD